MRSTCWGESTYFASGFVGLMQVSYFFHVFQDLSLVNESWSLKSFFGLHVQMAAGLEIIPIATILKGGSEMTCWVNTALFASIAFKALQLWEHYHQQLFYMLPVAVDWVRHRCRELECCYAKKIGSLSVDTSDVRGSFRVRSFYFILKQFSTTMIMSGLWSLSGVYLWLHEVPHCRRNRTVIEY